MRTGRVILSEIDSQRSMGEEMAAASDGGYGNGAPKSTSHQATSMLGSTTQLRREVDT